VTLKQKLLIQVWGGTSLTCRKESHMNITTNRKRRHSGNAHHSEGDKTPELFGGQSAKKIERKKFSRGKTGRLHAEKSISLQRK